MQKIAQLVLENIVKGKIDKGVGVEILKDLKNIEKVGVKEDLAVIGMDLRFPKANSPEEFWDALIENKDLISDFPENRKKDADAFIPYTHMRGRKGYEYCQAGYIDRIDSFDYKFFGISPKEASLMDPAQRLFLEVVFKTIEDAGYGGGKISGTNTGLYVGYSGWPMYGQLVSELEPENLNISMAGNISAIIAGRVSHFLDLKGPSMLIDTACSSSMNAFHVATRAIRNNDCEMAIVGGIRFILLPLLGIVQYGIEATDYRAKAFDDSADGTSLSEGIAAILIKPLSKAIRDGDNIHAVIKGSASNQDGHSMNVTAPNALAQEKLYIDAWQDAGVNPETIAFIEAHGTGTKLGDPIEIQSIQNAFQKFTDKKQFCAIGSVKSNMGHLDSSAGIAGVIKAILALKNRELPATLHFNRPNSKINFEASPVYVCKKNIKLERGETPIRCGVSSFGFSGTNCHVIFEEPPKVEMNKREEQDKYFIFTLSARSIGSMNSLIVKYRDFIEKNSNADIEDICYTASTGRGHYEHRLGIICKSTNQLLSSLEKVIENGLEATFEEEIYYGYHKSIPSNKAQKREEEITEAQKQVLGESVNVEIQKFLNEGNKVLKTASDICSLYIKGAPIQWESLYENEKRRKLSLPTYSFEETRCWINVPQNSKEVFVSNVMKEQVMSGFESSDGNSTGNRPMQTNKVVLKGKAEEDLSDIELALGNIWGAFFGLEEIDINDTFEDLGGDSMLAVQLVNRMKEEFKIVDMSDIFAYPSIESLAGYISSRTEISHVECEEDSEEEVAAASMDDMLEKLFNGEISIDDAQKLI